MTRPKNRHRSGLWGEISTGVSRIRIGCTGCSDVTVANGGGGVTRIGGTLSQKVLLGIESYRFLNESFGFAQGDTSITAETTSFSAVVLWFPWRTHFFIKGGVGLADGKFTVRPDTGQPSVAEGAGVGLTFGLGFDVPVSRKFAITANVGAWITAIGDIVLPSQRIDDVIPTTYLVSIGLTFR